MKFSVFPLKKPAAVLKRGKGYVKGLPAMGSPEKAAFVSFGEAIYQQIDLFVAHAGGFEILPGGSGKVRL